MSTPGPQYSVSTSVVPLPRHWRRNEDRLVKATLTDGSSLTGRVVSSTEESVTIEVSGTHREVAYADVAKALVQIEFNRKTEKPEEKDD